MPKSHSAASELAPLLDGSTAGELIPELVRHGLQQLIELEVAAVLGADRHERSEERLGYCNGYRPRVLTTQVGDIDLQIPKMRSGSFLPSILEPHRRVACVPAVGIICEAMSNYRAASPFSAQTSSNCSGLRRRSWGRRRGAGASKPAADAA